MKPKKIAVVGDSLAKSVAEFHRAVGKLRTTSLPPFETVENRLVAALSQVTEVDEESVEKLEMPPASARKVGRKLRKMRLRLAVTQGHMARMLGVSVAHYSAMESGTAERYREDVEHE